MPPHAGVIFLILLSVLLALTGSASIILGTLTLTAKSEGDEHRESAMREYNAVIASYDPSEMNQITHALVANNDVSRNFIWQTSKIIATGNNNTITTSSDYLATSSPFVNNNSTLLGFAITNVDPMPYYRYLPPLTRSYTYEVQCDRDDGCTSYYMNYYICIFGTYNGSAGYCPKGPCGTCTEDQYLSEFCLVISPRSSTPQPSGGTSAPTTASTTPSTQSPSPSTWPNQYTTQPPPASSTWPNQYTTQPPPASSTWPNQYTTKPPPASSTWSTQYSTWVPTTEPPSTPSPSNNPNNGTDHFNLTTSRDARTFSLSADYVFGVNEDYQSCQFPFTAGSNVYTTYTGGSASLNVRVRTTNDPYIALQRLTKGTQSFDVYLATPDAPKYLIPNEFAWPFVGGGSGALLLAICLAIAAYKFSLRQKQEPIRDSPYVETYSKGEVESSSQLPVAQPLIQPQEIPNVFILPPPPPGYVVYYLPPPPALPQQQQLYYMPAPIQNS